MHEAEIDLWEFGCDIRCVTTNGMVTKDNKNIMGAGVAREAAARFPSLPEELGAMLLDHGNHVYLFQNRIVTFPTIEHLSDGSTYDRVLRSVAELIALTDIYQWQKVALPQPGCGLGGLDWESLRPALALLLDDRFWVLDRPSRVMTHPWAELNHKSAREAE